MAKRVLVLFVAILTWSLPLGASLQAAPARLPSPFDGDPATTQRLEAGTPTAQAAAISRTRFADDGAAHVVLARDDVFADSLAGTSLLGDGPMLLVASGGIPPVTLAELDRVLADGGRVYLLGGANAIAPVVEAQLAEAGYDVARLAGATRVETSVAVAQEVLRLNPEATSVVLARAEAPAGNPTAAWADSVTGGGWAAWTGSPVVLTPGTSVHPAVAEFLATTAPARTVLLGGTAALSTAVEQSVPNPQRIAGANRADTAAAVALELWAGDPSRIILINGYQADGWAYGLPAAGLSADSQAPLLVSQAGTVPQESLALVAACGSGTGMDVLLAGGVAQLGVELSAQLGGSGGGACTPAVPDSAPPPPAPPAAPAPPAVGEGNADAADGCDPNYGGCVPIASDVDCADGSGDGPAYVDGPVQVIGIDVYGLDHDDDGTACED